MRNFFLKDGNHIREQLLALSDSDYISTYCILDATLPMKNYVATVQLKRVTDGERTFWHWESTFDVPKGREREFEQLVGGGVYEGGFRRPAELPERQADRPGRCARWKRKAWSRPASAGPRFCGSGKSTNRQRAKCASARPRSA